MRKKMKTEKQSVKEDQDKKERRESVKSVDE